jgi:Protein of unknown function (DUF3987)/VirE N-terminal domain
MQNQKETPCSGKNTALNSLNSTSNDDNTLRANVVNTKCSCFERATSTKPFDKTVAQILTAIRDGGKGGQLKGKIAQIRNRFDLESQIFPGDLKKAKESITELKHALPAVTWSGTFSERKSSALIQPSGLLCADLDNLGGRFADVRTALRRSPYIRAMFASPSGDGLKAVFRVPAEVGKHLASFRAIQQHIRELTGKEIDESGKDVARLCFMSHDPDIDINWNAKEIEPLPEPERPARTAPVNVDLNERQRIATELLGAIDWESDTSGVVTCPGKNLHTTGDNGRDCMVELDSVPTAHCFHNSCRGILDGVNKELRSRIGKAEFIPVNVASTQFPDSRGKTLNCVDVDRAIELPEAPAPYISPPLTLLPEALQDYIRAAADSLNVNAAYVLLPLLSSLGSAIGNARSILLKPGFVQPPVIWTGIVGRSGSRKSPALEAGCLAVIRHERELHRQNKQAMEQYENELSAWESRADRKTRGPKPTPRASQTCLMDDLTLEALADAIQNNPRGVLVRKDELSHWLASFDQYTNAKGADVSRWLSLHTAAFLAVDRRSDERRYRIHDPRVCITGGIQPAVLARALTQDFFERGLPARFLFAAPQIPTNSWSEITINDDLKQGALAVFDELWLLQPDNDEYGQPCPKLLRLDADAKVDYVAYFNECGAASVCADERGEAAFSKLDGYAARLALVGQLARDPDAGIVTGETMQAACDLARWFGNEAVRVYNGLGKTREALAQQKLAEFIESRGGEATIRDVITYYRPLRNQTEKAEAELYALKAAGFGDWGEVTSTPRGGKPTRRFILRRVCNTQTSTEGKREGYADRADSPKTSVSAIPPGFTYEKGLGYADSPSNKKAQSAGNECPPLVSLADMDARGDFHLDDPEWCKRILAEDALKREARLANWEKFNNGEPLPEAVQRKLERRVAASAWLEKYLSVA